MSHAYMTRECVTECMLPCIRRRTHIVAHPVRRSSADGSSGNLEEMSSSDTLPAAAPSCRVPSVAGTDASVLSKLERAREGSLATNLAESGIHGQLMPSELLINAYVFHACVLAI